MEQTQKTNNKCYYGAANTCDGFYSLFPEIFSPDRLNKIYILKGGPGCGKSTLMKKVQKAAEEIGFETEIYYCSSDPDSLDGVIIPDLSVAVLDGTAPHVHEPKYPAVCEKIINLGDAWNTVKASERDKEIKTLTNLKGKAYDKAYAYLSSCHGAQTVVDRCIQSYLMEEKMYKAVERLVSKLKFKKLDGTINNVFTDCVSLKGNVHLSTFEKNASSIYFVKDFAGLLPKYMEYLADELTSRGANIIVARNPVNPRNICGIYISDSNVSFTVYDDDFARTLDIKQIQYKIINTARFCNADIYRCQRHMVKYAEKAFTTLYQGAITQLEIASSIHKDIEKIYHDITDYSIVETISENLIKEIFT